MPCATTACDDDMVRISHLRISRFRGFHDFELRPQGHVLLMGMPRAGRSDLIAAIARTLHPGSRRLQPAFTDLHQCGSSCLADSTELAPSGGDGTDAPESAGRQVARVEITLTDLSEDLEQLCDGHLRPLNPDGSADLDGGLPAGRDLCVTITYELLYEAATDELVHGVYFGQRDEAGGGTRVPTMIRDFLPVVLLREDRPFQLRAEGGLREVARALGESDLADALQQLSDSVHDATAALSVHPSVTRAVTQVLDAGDIQRSPSGSEISADAVSFIPEDGSLAALLRGIQPAMVLNGGAALPLASHGSTVTALISLAEALARASTERALLLVDDFGDSLDSASIEHFARVIRDSSGQSWLTTRRPEAARAFDLQEIIRLSLAPAGRSAHSVGPISDRKVRTALRHLQTQLLPAATARTVVVVEGPHDVAAYAAVDRLGRGATGSLASHGCRLVSADNGHGGGTTQIPRVGWLARQLGFRVVALVDNDSGLADGRMDAIRDNSDVVVRLAPGMALEDAVLAGYSDPALRAAAALLTEFGIPDPSLGATDEAEVRSRLRAVLHKQSLHEPVVESLSSSEGLPPTMVMLLDLVRQAADPRYSGPQVMEGDSAPENLL